MSIEVAILGATGVVGQKAIALLQNKDHFKVVELVASEQRIRQKFGDVCDWRERETPLSKEIASIRLSSSHTLKSQFVISCLPGDVAATVELMLCEQGKFVFSNASTFRMSDDVPLLVPEINNAHLSLLEKQKTRGKIITNPNCSAVGVALALAPLMELGTINHVSVVTLQSVSGAGYPGVASLDILGNTVPHIEGEAEKITAETKKILGHPGKHASFAITTHVHRVPVTFGHTATLHVTFKKPITPQQALASYKKWNTKYPDLFVLHSDNGRPQANRDLTQNDMRIHIGHLCQGDLDNVIGLVVLSHNLVRGAAGAVIANMESYMQMHTAASDRNQNQ